MDENLIVLEDLIVRVSWGQCRESFEHERKQVVQLSIDFFNVGKHFFVGLHGVQSVLVLLLDDRSPDEGHSGQVTFVVFEKSFKVGPPIEVAHGRLEFGKVDN